MGCISWIAGKILCLFNLFFFLCGGVLLGIGIYLAVDSSGLTISGVVIPGAPSQGVWLTAVYITIGVAALVFVVGFLGCCGVRKDSKCLLNLYTALVIVCLLLEITVAIMAIVFNSQFTPSLEANMQTSIKTDYSNENATTSGSSDSVSYNWNVFQSQWQCCGADNYKDYQGSVFTNTTGLNVPYECCTRKEGTSKSDLSYGAVLNTTACRIEANQLVGTGSYTYLYSQGCYPAAKNWISSKSSLLIAIGFTFAGLQIIGLVLAMCVKGNIKE